MKPHLIVVVAKDSEAREILMIALERRHYIVWACTDVDHALALFLGSRPDMVLIDMDGQEDRAMDKLRLWNDSDSRTNVIVQSRYAEEIREDALSNGVKACLQKPLTTKILLDTLSMFKKKIRRKIPAA